MIPTIELSFSNCPTFLQRYLHYYQVFKNRDIATVRACQCNLIEFCRYVHFLYTEKAQPPTKDAHRDIDVRTMDPDEICRFSAEDLREYTNFADTVQKISPQTLRKRLSFLKGFYAYLDRYSDELGIRLVYGNIAASTPVPKYVSQVSQAVTLQQVTALLNSCTGETQLRDYALILTLATTGITLSEAAELNRSDLRGETLVVRGKQNKIRTLYLPPACQQALESYLRHVDQILFIEDLNTPGDMPLFMVNDSSRRMSHRAIQKRLEVAAHRARIDPAQVSVRLLRNTAALLLLESSDRSQDSAIAQYLGLSGTGFARRYLSDEMRNVVGRSKLSKLGGTE